MRQATVGPWFWVLTVDIGHVSFSLEHRLSPPSRALGYVKDWTPPTSRENCKGRKHLHARIPVAHDFKGNKCTAWLCLSVWGFRGARNGKSHLDQIHSQTKGMKSALLCFCKRSTDITAEAFPWLLSGFLTTSHRIGHHVRLQLHTYSLLKQTADLTRSAQEAHCAGNMHSGLLPNWWAHSSESSFKTGPGWTLESCCSGCTVALAIEPVKTPHFGP